MSVIVVATVHPVPEHRVAAIAAFEDTIASVHAEDEGCQFYALHEGDDRLVMIEKWVSQEALTSHSGGSALAELTRRLAGKLIGGLDVQVLRPHPAGTTQQGAI